MAANQETKRHGGPRPNAGRKPGTRNAKTLERERVVEEQMAKVAALLGVDRPFEGDAVALMQMLYRDPAVPLPLRFEAAKQAAPFERPKLAAVEPVPPGTFLKHEDALAELEDDDDEPAREGAAA